MTYDCQTYQQEALPVLGIRTHTPVENLPQTLGRCYASIAQHMAGLGAAPGGLPYVAYFNMNMQDLDLEVGFQIASPLPGNGEVQAGALPNKPVAACTYTGPYPQMASAYEELTRWVAEKGLQASGVVYEFYLNDPASTAPEELQTQIVFILS